MARVVYKISSRSAWDEAVRLGAFHGSADDRRDGFIHLSTREQVVGTLARHFAGAADLVLVAIDEARLGAPLRWEPASSGKLYPHLYAPLPTVAAVSVHALGLGDDGRHQLPDGVWDGHGQDQSP